MNFGHQARPNASIGILLSAFAFGFALNSMQPASARSGSASKSAQAPCFCSSQGVTSALRIASASEVATTPGIASASENASTPVNASASEITLTPGIASAAGYIPTAENLAARKEFADEKFGIFLHWGVYSMLGRGEWVLQTQKLRASEYSLLARGFYPSQFNAHDWVAAFKAAGAKYVCITTRHHDGFSMFGTSASPFNIVDATPFHRDIIGEIAEECHKQGLKIHFYYSLLDWTRDDYYPLGRTGHDTGRDFGAPSTSALSQTSIADTSWTNPRWQSYKAFMKQQLTELLTRYGDVGAIWFDGLWDRDEQAGGEDPGTWGLYDIYNLIHRLQPSCLIGNNHHESVMPGEDIQIFEKDIPGENTVGLSGQEVSRLPLETCQTMNDSWGYNIYDHNYKSAECLIKYLEDTNSKGANLLLNIGPRPDGTLPDEALAILRAFAARLR